MERIRKFTGFTGRIEKYFRIFPYFERIRKNACYKLIMTSHEKYLATFYPAAQPRQLVKAVMESQPEDMGRKERQPRFSPEFLRKTSMLRSH